jgi:threonylcarbamoyladenosine tRNA methylthiotransferase MtaB
VHLGGWGEDLGPRATWRASSSAIAEHGLVPRLRLSSIDPHEVTEPLVRRDGRERGRVPASARPAAGWRRRRPPAHAPPLRHGPFARERLAMITSSFPTPPSGTDVIAGFPGRDAAAFERTLALLEETPISYCHVGSRTRSGADDRRPSSTATTRPR